MSLIQPFVTVRDPKYSLWQSIVEKVAKARAAGHLTDAVHAHVADHDGIEGTVSGAAAAPAALAAKLTGLLPAKTCSALAARLAWAKVAGSAAEVAALQAAFDFNVCDLLWVECVDAYVAYYQVHGGAIAYRDGLNNVLPTPVPAKARIAIFGDWGTGMPSAVALLQQIQTLKPDVLMHLGDIYYSGTMDEVQARFLNICTDVFDPLPPTFSLAGNHDMYSGGAGYYWLVDQLGQGASYFALQNADWLFIAMDTGRHDFDPLKVSSTTTFLEKSEAAWINGLIGASQDQKIVLFSHHPLFSAYEPIAGDPINPLLYSQLAASLPKVTAWFWGHEHRLAVYGAFKGLTRGRLLGHGAIPVFAGDDGDPPKFDSVPVLEVNGVPLDPGVAEGVFKHGFAILELDGKDATTSYYRAGEDEPFWSETF